MLHTVVEKCRRQGQQRVAQAWTAPPRTKFAAASDDRVLSLSPYARVIPGRPGKEAQLPSNIAKLAKNKHEDGEEQGRLALSPRWLVLNGGKGHTLRCCLEHSGCEQAKHA